MESTKIPVILAFLLFLVAFFVAGGTGGSAAQMEGAHQFHRASEQTAAAPAHRSRR